VIEPNRLSAPGEAAARQRVEVVFAAIDGIPTDRLHGVALSPRDGDKRDRLIEMLEGAVAAAGRDALLDEARDSVRNVLSQRLAVVFPAGQYGLTLHATGRPADQAELVAAIDDAVAVAVAEDLLDPAHARELSEPGRALLGLPSVGNDDAEPTPAPGRGRGRPTWEPTEADWADAQRPVPADNALLPGVRGLWQLFLGAVAVFGIVATIALGVASDQPWLGLLGAVAIAAVCWTLATFRRAT
jgi:hypothetical protein